MEEPRLNLVEQRLVAAVKAGGELDLSQCPEQERTLRASVLYYILHDSAVAKPGAGVRLRGAVIEGDLDLSQVKTSMTVELANCQVTRICLAGASLSRFSLRTDVTRSRWVKEARALRDTIGKEPAFITALLFGFVVLKVIWIARGDIPTALGVFDSAGLATVIAGGLLSAFPLISAVMLGFATFELGRGWPFGKACLLERTGLLFALFCAMSLPW